MSKKAPTPARRKGQPPPSSIASMRGSSRWWVATVLIVTAGLGAGLILAEFVSAAIDHSASKVPSSVVIIFVAGALGGIWGGAYLAGRLTRGNRRRFLGAGAGGVLGLVVGLGLIRFHTNFLGFLQAVVALLLPGTGAAVGSWLAQRGSPPPPAVAPKGGTASGGKASGGKGSGGKGSGAKGSGAKGARSR